jgi:hypothetical protein
VRIEPAGPGEPAQTFPQFEPMQAAPGMAPAPRRRAWFAGLTVRGAK